MKYRFRSLGTAFVALWLVLGISSCSDNSSSEDPDNGNSCSSLSLPSELAPAMIDLEYFNENPDIPNDEDHMVYQQVKSIANSANALFSFGGSAVTIQTFLTVAPGLNVDPEFQNGNCVWSFNLSEIAPQFGINASIMVIANQTGEQVNWQVIYDGEFEEQEVTDFLFLEGFTSNDGMSGEWNVYDPEAPSEPSATYTWTVESENNYELNFDAFEEGQGDVALNYMKSAAENNLDYSIAGESDLSVYWNEETDSGWLEEEGEERRCYTDFVNSACPS